MSKTCAFFGCTTKISKINSMRLFAFPKNPEIRKQWVDVCGDPLLNPNKSKICHLHFQDEDYRLQDRLLNIPKSKRKLIDTAVPKIINEYDNYADLSVNSKWNINFDSKVIFKNEDLETNTIEFIDISRCSTYKDKENDSYQYIKFYKDSAVQCNLYEELWNEKIDSCRIECNCIQELFETLKFSKEEIITENTVQISDSFENGLNCDEIQNDCFENTKTRNIKQQKRIRKNDLVKFSKDSGYQCEKCYKICLNLAAYYAHSNSHLEQSSICSKCGINLTTHKMAANHERYCLNKTKVSGGNESENIIISSRKHSINKTCVICDRTFEKYVTYMDHMNIHNNCKPYICSCLSSFTHYSNFMTHLIKFKCPVQGRIIPKYAPQGQTSEMIEMKQKGLLKQTKRFKCRICGVSYARDRYLQHFYEKIHLDTEETWLKKFNIKKTFACSHCYDHVFDNLSDCIRHRSKVHRKFPNDEYLKTFEISAERDCNYLIENIQEDNNNVERVKLIRNYINRPNRINQLSSKEKYCPICNKYFVKRITFLDHMNIHKKSYPYICSCGVRKRYYQSFLTHIQKTHCRGKRIFPDYAPKTFANYNPYHDD